MWEPFDESEPNFDSLRMSINVPSTPYGMRNDVDNTRYLRDPSIDPSLSDSLKRGHDDSDDEGYHSKLYISDESQREDSRPPSPLFDEDNEIDEGLSNLFPIPEQPSVEETLREILGDSSMKAKSRKRVTKSNFHVKTNRPTGIVKTPKRQLSRANSRGSAEKAKIVTAPIITAGTTYSPPSRRDEKDWTVMPTILLQEQELPPPQLTDPTELVEHKYSIESSKGPNEGPGMTPHCPTNGQNMSPADQTSLTASEVTTSQAVSPARPTPMHPHCSQEVEVVAEKDRQLQIQQQQHQSHAYHLMGNTHRMPQMQYQQPHGTQQYYQQQSPHSFNTRMSVVNPYSSPTPLANQFPYASPYFGAVPSHQVASSPYYAPLNGASPHYNVPATPMALFPRSIKDEIESPGNVRKGKMIPTSIMSRADHEVFCEVTSHIVINAKKKNQITIGEIRRRMGAPEFQDVKMIQRLARHARTSTKIFMKKFVTTGIEFGEPTIDRPPSTISMLMEDDALTLAKDFNKLASTELNKGMLLCVVLQAVPPDRREEVAQRATLIVEHLYCVRQHLLSAGRTPDTAKINNPVGKYSLETHGFGPLATLAVIESLISVVKLMRLPEYAGYITTNLASEISQPASTSTEVDHSLLIPRDDDSSIYDGSVLPRIGYDVEPIEMTVGELRRRVYGMEKFQGYMIIAFIRKAKVTDTLPKINEGLKKFGIEFVEKPKKGLQSSSWTSLSEREAMALAAETAESLMKLPAWNEMRERSRGDSLTAAWLRFIANTVEVAMMRIKATPEERAVETVADMHVLRFALITHHFGHNFYASVMRWLQNVV